MALKDWCLMRTRRLRQLDDAILVYQQYISEWDETGVKPEEVQARWNREAELIANIHEVVHRLRDALSADIFITNAVAGNPLKELPKLGMEKPKNALVDLRPIHDSLPAKNLRMLPEREAVALYVVDELIAYVGRQLKKVRQAVPGESEGHDENDEARGIFEFLALVSHYHDKSIIDSQHTGDFAEEIWKMIEKRDDKLCQELKDLTPPLTWGETLYHFLDNLEANKGKTDVDRQRKRIGEYLFPIREFYCLLCDRPFAVDSRHPGRFICKRCRATERKRNERQRKQGISSGQMAVPKAQ